MKIKKNDLKEIFECSVLLDKVSKKLEKYNPTHANIIRELSLSAKEFCKSKGYIYSKNDSTINITKQKSDSNNDTLVLFKERFLND